MEVRRNILDAQEKIENLGAKLSDDTLVIVSADHGHRNIEKVYQILDFPEINDCLIMPVSLESRVVTFWVKEEKKKKFEIEFKEKFGNDFWLFTRDDFLELGFLGNGIMHPKIPDFIGNYIAISISSSIIRIETYLAEGKPVKKSTHCGLTEEEMVVPVIAF